MTLLTDIDCGSYFLIFIYYEINVLNCFKIIPSKYIYLFFFLEKGGFVIEACVASYCKLKNIIIFDIYC